jgi:hypothetical protein
MVQMDNTRRINQRSQTSPQPPVNMEQQMVMQTQLLQHMAQNMQNNNQNGNGNAPPQVRDKRGEFLKGHPPVYKAFR